MLNGYQQDAFVTLAHRVIMADGYLHEVESALLQIRYSEMGNKTVRPPSQLEDLPNLSLFDDYSSRVIVMLELYVLAYSDKHLHPEEIPVLHELADVFGFTREALEPLKAWAKGQAPYSVAGWNLIQGSQAIPIG